MISRPRVSIVTRTKNRPVLLRRALASVLDQDFAAWEMLIVNDGGDREPVERLVAEVAIPAQGRIRLIHNSQSLGMEAASNRALDDATGEYVVIHDDDDSWEPRFLSTCVAHMDGAEECVGGVVTLSAKVVERLEEDSVHIESIEPYTPNLTTITLLAMARSNMFPPIAFLFRRSALDAVGRYRRDLPVLGDWEFNLRFLARYEIEVIEDSLANYHFRPATRSGIYSNTVIGGLDLHRKYDTRLRNEWLREDLRAGKAGLGFLVNMGRMFNDQLWELKRGQLLGATLSRLQANGVRRLAVYGAGEIGRKLAADAQAHGFTVDRIVDRNCELWGTEVDGVEISGLDQALDEGCDTFVIASLTFAKEIRAAIDEASRTRGVQPRVFELAAAA
jgi:glycosyltransferase involved in cell wall biosynthesis